MGFTKICKLDEVPLGTAKVVQLIGREISVWNVRGQIYAIDNICTHDEEALDQGELIGCEVECPRHGARFDVRSGQVTEGPAVSPVDKFSVRVLGEDIEIDF